jgi:hypothetical protein
MAPLFLFIFVVHYKNYMKWVFGDRLQNTCI